MNSELFLGTPEALQLRLVALIAGAAITIDQVLLSHEKGKYIIIWS